MANKRYQEYIPPSYWLESSEWLPNNQIKLKYLFIPDTLNKYVVSNYGNIHLLQKKRLCKALKPDYHNGRPFVSLFCFKHYIDELVLEAFVGPKPPDCYARHYPDPDLRNNKLTNLLWSVNLDREDVIEHEITKLPVINPRSFIGVPFFPER